jgi:hypothetical protein
MLKFAHRKSLRKVMIDVKNKQRIIIKLRYALLCDNATAIEQASQELGNLIEAEKNTPSPHSPHLRV